jgi:uncharacterized protein
MKNIFMLIKNDNIEGIRKELKSNPNLVHATNKHKETPLIVAAYRGCKEIVGLLLDAKADVNASCLENIGSVSSVVARIYGEAKHEKEMQILDVLIESGADVNTGDKSDCTPLHHAAESGNLHLLSYLLAHGAAPSLTVRLDSNEISLQLVAPDSLYARAIRHAMEASGLPPPNGLLPRRNFSKAF